MNKEVCQWELPKQQLDPTTEKYVEWVVLILCIIELKAGW
jgi:hypothetical protein